jgi:hypothetical protein
VLFNGWPVVAAIVGTDELSVTVPTDASAGPVPFLVVTDRGYAMSPMPFIVRRPSAAK